MPTQNITVDGVSGDTGNFSITGDDVTIVQAVSDGDTSTNIVNTAPDKQLTFTLQNASDFAVFSGATFQSVKALIVASQIGKGEVTFNVKLSSTSGTTFTNNDFTTANSDATNFEGGVGNNGGSGFTPDQLNDMILTYTTTNSTQPRLYDLNVEVTYIAASGGGGTITLSSGLVTLTGGTITI